MEKLPKFKTAKEEAEFWETHSPLDFPGEFEDVEKPVVDRRKKGIYIRVDPGAIMVARRIGAQLGIGYQTLFRMWIMEGLVQSLQGGRQRLYAGPHSFIEEMLSKLPPESQDRVTEVFRRAVESEIGNLQGRYGARSSS